ncbi:hypothetical protein FZC43_09260 [Francisella adeliensis]|nr:hypothetical protein FZC43_09260 [Francisella adeliensis]
MSGDIHHISRKNYDRAKNWELLLEKQTGSSREEYVKTTIKKFFQHEIEKSSMAISSLITFVYYSILFEATYFSVDERVEQLPKILKCIFTLHTSARIDLKGSINEIINLLSKKNPFCLKVEQSFVKYENLSEIEKLQYIFYEIMTKNPNLGCAENYLPTNLLSKFININSPKKNYSSKVSVNTSKDELTADLERFMIFCEKITRALNEYTEKFMSKKSILTDNGYIASSIGEINIPVHIPLMQKSISNLIAYIIRTEGYGFINRHGVSGQIRTFLFASFVYNSLAFIKNEYENYTNRYSYEVVDSLSTESYNPSVRKQTVTKYMDSFFMAYRQAFKYLPNQNKSGSLSFYLSMYCDPKSEPIGKMNIPKIQKWERDRVH